jgi:hypothetical protein
MRVDLFELIDGVFKGIVYFFYNVFETVYQLVRRPFRGPLRLYQRNRNPRIRQIAGVTFLFLCFLIFFAVHLGSIPLHLYDGTAAESIDSVRESIGSALLTTPSFSLDQESLWPVIGAALASTVILDALLRLSLRATIRRSPGRREMVLAATEYALFLMIAVATILTFLPSFGLSFLMAPDYPPAGLQLLPFVPFLLVALLPAAALVTTGAKLRRLTFRIGRMRVSVPGWIFLAVAALVAARTGAELGYTRGDWRDGGEQDPVAHETPELIYLDCKLGQPPPSVDAVVWNKLDKPVVQRADGYSVILAEDLDDQAKLGEARFLGLVLAEANPPNVLVLGPGEVRRLRFMVPDYASFAEDRGRQCGMAVASQTYERGIGDFPMRDYSIE